MRSNLASTLSRNRNSVCLILILILGFVLRLVGINWGLPDWILPSSLHPNESDYVLAGINVSNGVFSDVFWSKPSNLWIVMLGALFFIPTQLDLFADITSYYVLARFFVIILSVLTIWLTYKTSRELFGAKRIALLPPLIISIMMLHIYESHFAWMNIPAAFLGALSLFYASRILTMAESENPDRRKLILNLVLSSVALGIGVSLKYQLGFIVFPLIVSVCYLRFEPEIKIRMLFTVGFITVLTFLLTNSYWLFDFRRGLSSVLGTHYHYSTGYNGIIPTVGLTYIDTYSNIFSLLQWWTGIPLAFLFILGVINSLSRHKKVDIFLLSSLIPFYLFFGYHIFAFGRHLLPSLVLISILISKFVYDSAMSLSNFGKRCSKEKDLALAVNIFTHIIVLCLVFSLLYSLAFVNIFRDTEGDTRIQASNWIKENIPEGSSIGIDDSTSQWMMHRPDKRKYRVVEDYSETDYTIITSPLFWKMQHYIAHKEQYKEEDWYPSQPPSGKKQRFYTSLFDETSHKLVVEFHREPNIFGLQLNTSEASYHIWAVTHPTIRIYRLKE